MINDLDNKVSESKLELEQLREKYETERQEQRIKLQRKEEQFEFKLKQEQLKKEAKQEQKEYRARKQKKPFIKNFLGISKFLGRRDLDSDWLSQFLSIMRYGSSNSPEPRTLRPYGLTYRPTREIISGGTFDLTMKSPTNPVKPVNFKPVPSVKKMFSVKRKSLFNFKNPLKRGQFFFLDLVMLVLVFIAFVGIAPALKSVIDTVATSAGYDAFLGALIGLFPAFILLCIFLSGLYIATPFARLR